MPAGGDGADAYAAVRDPDGDGLGDVVILSAQSGAVLETVYRATAAPGVEEGGASGAVSVDVAGDGTIYYEVCCERASGEIRGFDPSRGEDLGRISNGTSPAVSPDGRRLALAAPPDPPGHIAVIDLETGRPEEETWPVGGRPSSDVVTDLAWSPAGRTMRGRAPQLRGRRLRRGGRRPPRHPDRDLDPCRHRRRRRRHAAFRADGTLLVASPACETADSGPIVGDRVVLWDPAARRVDASIGMDRVADLDASPNGNWVIASPGAPPPGSPTPEASATWEAIAEAPERGDRRRLVIRRSHAPAAPRRARRGAAHLPAVCSRRRPSTLASVSHSPVSRGLARTLGAFRGQPCSAGVT